MPIHGSSLAVPKGESNLFRVFGGFAIFFLLFVLVFFVTSKIQERRKATVDQEMIQTARELSSKVEVSEVFFNTGENFLGDRVRYLNGTVTNHADRPLELVEMTFIFVDQLGQVVLRESKRPIDGHKAALKPNESREFAIGFEKMPADWNRQHPSIQITRLKFAK